MKYASDVSEQRERIKSLEATLEEQQLALEDVQGEAEADGECSLLRARCQSSQGHAGTQDEEAAAALRRDIEETEGMLQTARAALVALEQALQRLSTRQESTRANLVEKQRELARVESMSDAERRQEASRAVRNIRQSMMASPAVTPHATSRRE